jgi:hypothetical protein
MLRTALSCFAWSQSALSPPFGLQSLSREAPLASVDIDDDEIVDAIIANPDLIVRAFTRLLECNESPKAHADRQLGITVKIANAAERERRERNSHYRPLKCSQCHADSIALWEGGLCGPCASGTEARRAETGNTGSVHDGPVPKADAQTSASRDTREGEE